MFKLNRYIFLFMAVIFLAIGVLWKIVQSESFANLIVHEVSERFLVKENVSFDVQKVEISLFPPATHLKNLDLGVKKEGLLLSVRARRASIEFSFINLLSSDLVVDKISLADSFINLEKGNSKKGEGDKVSEINTESILKDMRGAVSSVHDLIPFSLNGVELDNVRVSNKKDEVEIYHSKLRLYKNYLVGNVELRKIDIKSLKERRRDLKELDQVAFGLELADNYLTISDLKINRMLDAISGEVNIRFDNYQVQGILKYTGGLEWPIVQLKKSSDIELSAKGHTQTLVEIEGPTKDLRFQLDSQVHNLVSDEIKADSLSVQASYNSGIVTAKRAVLKDNNGEAKLAKQVVVLDNDGVTDNKLTLVVSNLSTGTAFHPIRDVLGIVKGRLFGAIDIEWVKGDENIEFSIPDELRVTDFVLGEDPLNPILINPELVLSETKVILDIGAGVYIDSRVSFGNSGFKVKGRVADKEVAFVTKDGKIDFSELGPIAGTTILGKGDLGLKVYGPEDNVIFDILLKTKESEVLGYKLGEIEADLIYSLKGNSLKVRSFKGQQRESTYSGTGHFVFEEGHSGFELQVETQKMSYADSQKVLAPLFEELSYVPEELSFLANGDFRLKSDFEKDELVVEGPLFLNYIDFFGEAIDSLRTQLEFEQGRLSLNKIQLKKGEGSLKGSFKLDTNTDSLEYDGKWQNIRPNDFNMYRQLNLGLETNATLEIYGSGPVDDLTTNSKIVTKNSRIQGSPFGESTVELSGQSGLYELEGSLFEKSISLSSFIDLSSGERQESSIDASVDFSDIRDLLGVLSAHNSQRDDLEGTLKATMKSSFNTDNMQDLDLNLNLSELDVRYKEIELTLDTKRELLIKNGLVQRSHLGLHSSDFYITPLLNGSLKDGFTLDVGYRLPFSLLELVTSEVEVSKGVAYGVVAMGGPLEQIESYAETNIENMVMQTSYVPGAFREGSLRAVLDNKFLKLDSFKASYGKGSIHGQGQIILSFPFPIVKIEGSISDAFIPLMNRSGMVLSGQLDLSGEKLPYRLDGDVTVLFAEILEDINEFQKQQASSKSYQRFLPQSEGRQRELIDLNLNINVQRPIQVRNSLLELNIDGAAQVSGPPSFPRPKGHFQVVPSSSKFKFKGHEFALTKGTIDLGEDFNREGARLDFSGVTQINEYKVRLNVSGRTKNVEVSLSSEPGLSQENLFSLLTLGVTSEVSTELDENERQSVATVGLGALLADQLKLNEGLDSSFGLRLSVLPEYAEESDALLQGKSAVSDSGTSRFRSSTKVRVQKKISDKVDLSVSSTVGGSLEQRQEMNVNYKFNNKWSLEGVYELKSTDDEGVESSDSIGADLKYRWSF